MNIVNFGAELRTMSSHEIAKITGKDLSHVRRDIRAMVGALGDDPDLDHLLAESDARGYVICYHLNKVLSLTLVSGYSIPMRAKIVDRWEALETGKAVPAMVAQPYSAAVEAIQVADALAKMLRLEGSARLDVAQKAVKIRAPDLLPMVPVYATNAK